MTLYLRKEFEREKTHVQSNSQYGADHHKEKLNINRILNLPSPLNRSPAMSLFVLPLKKEVSKEYSLKLRELPPC